MEVRIDESILLIPGVMGRRWEGMASRVFVALTALALVRKASPKRCFGALARVLSVSKLSYSHATLRLPSLWRKDDLRNQSNK